ncbi:MarR family transcriptional regulator [Mariniflexile gromovii]|uniref:MarR family transcriptional regulator n=1 Tax=Mariniflexile gromovii TaxID=362523 RepID=A0ABS4BWV4_9FLAO|nr:helix-turn-helix domain-containing protein [Mariniflexile gromovii]MBP0904858.1 hypothetical protein [Mariniflexile gromovii]
MKKENTSKKECSLETFLKTSKKIQRRRDINAVQKDIISYIIGYQINKKFCYESQGDFAFELGIDKSTLTRNIDDLVKKGILQKGQFKDFGITISDRNTRKVYLYVEELDVVSLVKEIQGFVNMKSIKETQVKKQVAEVVKNEPIEEPKKEINFESKSSNVVDISILDLPLNHNNLDKIKYELGKLGLIEPQKEYSTNELYFLIIEGKNKLKIA